MDTSRREKIQRNLRNLAQTYSAMMALMEQTLVLLQEELARGLLAFSDSKIPDKTNPSQRIPHMDHDELEVHFRGKTCAFGNTLPFRFLDHLVRHLNKYVTYEELLDDVWKSRRSDEAVRSVVKRLRQRLRRDGMSELANAIDGSHAGRYALRIKL